MYNLLHTRLACPKCGASVDGEVNTYFGSLALMLNLKLGDRYPWVDRKQPQNGGRPEGGNTDGEGFMVCPVCKKDSHLRVIVRGDVIVAVEPDHEHRGEAGYRRITQQEFDRLQADPKAVESFFGACLEHLNDLDRLKELDKLYARMQEQESSGHYLGIGEDWHALHFLLTGDAELKPHSLPPPPLGNVVLGGTDTQWPCRYGNVRSLKPSEVRAVADALTRISVHELRSRFTVDSFNTAQIHRPHPVGRPARWTAEGGESVFEIYPHVVEFFQAAARNGDMVLLSFD